MPKVSVLMPVYKTDENYLKEAMESILTQTFKDFEFLILDDCPEDSREEIVKSYKDPRIKYFKNEKNLGISKARNKLIDLAEGEYLAVFDHDDISLPERLEKEVNYLDTHAEVGVVSCEMDYFLQNRITAYPEDNLEIKRQLMHENVVAHTAMMVRKSLLEHYNIRYEEEYSPAEDYMICLRLMKYTMFHNLTEVLVKYRFFDGNTTCTQSAKMTNAFYMGLNFAAKEYPYFFNWNNSKSCYKKTRIKLFGAIPFIKITHERNADRRICLFNIPFLTAKDDRK